MHCGEVDSEDILKALAALLPRHAGKQLWREINPGFRRYALWCATNLGSAYVDAETAAEVWKEIIGNGARSSHFIDDLHAVAGIPRHPLNADFVDKELRLLAPFKRDLLWSEWLRERRSIVRAKLNAFVKKWNESTQRSESDRLQMIWCMWMLGSTAHDLRDHATHAIYVFGKGGLTELLAATERSLDINDPYIPERMLAALYGSLMGVRDDLDKGVRDAIGRFASYLAGKLSKVIDRPMHHIQMRDYALGILRWIDVHVLGGSMGAKIDELDGALSQPMGDVYPVLNDDSPEEKDASGCLRMDFENYTIGRLIPGRRNYDSQHVGYRKVRGSILWRVRDLGWSKGLFESLDNRIADEQLWRGRIESDESNKIDRYGKKYARIAYLELRSHLPVKDEGISEFYTRTWDQDIDPSFPEPPLHLRLGIPSIVNPDSVSRVNWKGGLQPGWVRSAVERKVIGPHKGPWILVDGYVGEKHDESEREAFVFFRTFFLEISLAKEFMDRLKNQNLSGRWLPDKPSVYGIIAGEMPWSRVIPDVERMDVRFVVGRKVSWEKTSADHLVLREFLRRFNKGDEVAIPSRIRKVTEITKDYSVRIPVFDHHRDGRDLNGHSIGGTTLAVEIARKLKLRTVRGSFDFEDVHGVRMSIETDVRDDRGDESFTFVRKESIRKYLKRDKLCAILVAWGEKNLIATSGKNFARRRKRIDLNHVMRVL